MIPTKFNALEWLSQNLHRAYPLDDTVSGATTIPSQLLADAFVLVSGAVDSDCSLYVSRILVTEAAVTIYLSGTIADADVEHLPVASFALTDVIGAEASTQQTIGEYCIYTKFVAGDLSCIQGRPVVLDIPEDEGKLFSGCVRGLSNDVHSGLVVNGTRMADIVTLEAGEGIELSLLNFSCDAVLSAGQDTFEGVISGELSATLNSPAGTACDFSDVAVSQTGELTAVVTVNGSPYTFSGTMISADGIIIKPPHNQTWSSASVDAQNSVFGSVLRISATGYSAPTENTEITTTEELISRAVSMYGIPIRSINGVYPDSSGNISIVGDGSTVVNSATNNTTDYLLEIASADGQAGAITVKLSKNLDCDTSEVIQTLLENVAELNKRGTHLSTHITALDTANSNLAARLTGLV